jgi:hypothetical protein
MFKFVPSATEAMRYTDVTREKEMAGHGRVILMDEGIASLILRIFSKVFRQIPGLTSFFVFAKVCN